MKYFVVSDIHSFYDELMDGLKEANFNINNPNHIIVFDGDLFDRGDKTLELFDFINSIPKERRIMIRGNHEGLYLDLLNKKFPDSYDFSNGTIDTFCQISKTDPNRIDFNDTDNWLNLDFDVELKDHYNSCLKEWKNVTKIVKNSKITKFIKSDEWINYFQIDKFIITHSFIPNIKNWRDADQAQWNTATWGCPWKQYRWGYFDEEKKKGNILVCGHWHTSDFYVYLNGEIAVPEYKIYYGKNIIGIDGGVRYDRYNNKLTHVQNVLVIDTDNKTYGDKYQSFKY